MNRSKEGRLSPGLISGKDLFALLLDGGGIMGYNIFRATPDERRTVCLKMR